MTGSAEIHIDYDRYRRCIRIVQLLDASSRAGLAPIEVLRLHSLAYLVNVLAPVWDLPALDGKVLKQQGGPFYPELQADVDRLVGSGVVIPTEVDYLQGPSGRWRISARYRLNPDFSRPVLEAIRAYPDFLQALRFCHEVAYAISRFPDDQIAEAMIEDATYSDGLIASNNVIDFAEWSQRNPALEATVRLGNLIPLGGSGSPGERLHLYAKHLHRRIMDQTART